MPRPIRATISASALAHNWTVARLHAASARIWPVINNPEQVEILKRGKIEGELDVYLKVNSGMNRLGFGVEGLRPAYNALRARPQVKGLTLMTHFADADGPGGIKAQLD